MDKSMPQPQSSESTTEFFDLDSIQPSHHEIGQEGPYIICRTPGHEHGFYIGPDKELVRLSDGTLDIRTIK